jgi:hypothetical protein
MWSGALRPQQWQAARMRRAGPERRDTICETPEERGVVLVQKCKRETWTAGEWSGEGIYGGIYRGGGVACMGWARECGSQRGGDLQDDIHVAQHGREHQQELMAAVADIC